MYSAVDGETVIVLSESLYSAVHKIFPSLFLSMTDVLSTDAGSRDSEKTMSILVKTLTFTAPSAGVDYTTAGASLSSAPPESPPHAEKIIR